MGCVPGIIRTRVGYAGGTKKDPTYHDLGDHSETIQIDYDPKLISYKELLDHYFSMRNFCAQPGIRQYMSIIFYHNDEQKKLALAARERAAGQLQDKVVAEIVPLQAFYLAEDYHQKYYLREHSDLLKEFQAMYPDAKDFTNSTAAARVNGYVDGHGTVEQLDKEIDRLGLSDKGKAKLRELVRRRK